jgi:hypothetical protein
MLNILVSTEEQQQILGGEAAIWGGKYNFEAT